MRLSESNEVLMACYLLSIFFTLLLKSKGSQRLSHWTELTLALQCKRLWLRLECRKDEGKQKEPEKL